MQVLHLALVSSLLLLFLHFVVFSGQVSMFDLRTVGSLTFGSGTQETLNELPHGQLHFIRPLSIKGYSQLVFRDSAICIRPGSQRFQHQLVVQGVFEEGGSQLLAEEGEVSSESGEKIFLLDESLAFCFEIRGSVDRVLIWKDPLSRAGDAFQFICGSSISTEQVQKFVRVAQECQYEHKYRKPASTVTESSLAQFGVEQVDLMSFFGPRQRLPQARHVGSVDDMLDESATNYMTTQDSVVVPEEEGSEPEVRQVYAHLRGAELHLFIPEFNHFALVDNSVTAEVSEIGRGRYWLHIEAEDKTYLGTEVVVALNPVFDFQCLSFVFNHSSNDDQSRSWRLRVEDQLTLEMFQKVIMRAIQEDSKKASWTQIQNGETKYAFDSLDDLNLEDASHTEEEKEHEDGEEEEEEKEEEEEEEGSDSSLRKDDGGEFNSQLAVGYKHDRSFVVRGSKIGVFRHLPSNRLQFATNISKVQTVSGKLMKPSNVLLHNENRHLILQNEIHPDTLHRMDLEYGRVVDEWKIHDVPVVAFAPEKKFAPRTSEPTFLGISDNSLYRIDPRLPGNKVVNSDKQQYASRTNFSALATTEKGYIAVASNKGDIRLFDRLGIRAKTQLPALGNPITGIDVAANGRWILGTTKNYLLLVDVRQKSGQNEFKLGFEESFSATDKPRPRRLALTSEHVAQFYHETGKPINFTPAKFNTDQQAEETSIITGTGPYIIEWNLKRILQGSKVPYKIKRYADDVKAEDFKYGSDNAVIAALPNEVDITALKSLRKPTKESIVGGFRLSDWRKASTGIIGQERGNFKLGKRDIVNSPY